MSRFKVAVQRALAMFHGSLCAIERTAEEQLRVQRQTNTLLAELNQELAHLRTDTMQSVDTLGGRVRVLERKLGEGLNGPAAR